MKRIVLFTLLIFSVIGVKAQPYTFLYDNFDVECASSTYTPSGWLHYNPLIATDPAGAWHCNATTGRSGTPGVECSGTYGGSFNLDTSYFISPVLNLSGYTGNVYLHFDSKTDSIFYGGKLSVLRVIDTPYSPGSPTTDLTPGVTPIISSFDSLGWVTHQVDLSPYAGLGTPPFYIAFRYVSSNSSGSKWHLDNINVTSITTLSVSGALKEKSLPGIISSTSSQIVFSYSTETAGICPLTIYDMVGRKVYTGTLNIQAGTTNYTLSDLNLHAGMYIMKLENKNNYSATKVMVE